LTDPLLEKRGKRRINRRESVGEFFVNKLFNPLRSLRHHPHGIPYPTNPAANESRSEGAKVCPRFVIPALRDSDFINYKFHFDLTYAFRGGIIHTDAAGEGNVRPCGCSTHRSRPDSFGARA